MSLETISEENVFSWKRRGRIVEVGNKTVRTIKLWHFGENQIYMHISIEKDLEGSPLRC